MRPANLLKHRHQYAIIIFNYLVGHLGFSAAEALIPGVIQGFTNIVAAGVAIAVLPRIGGWAGMCYGLVISVIEGAFRAFGGRGGIYTAYVLSSFAFAGFAVNGSLMITSSRVGQTEQTKNQGNVRCLGKENVLVAAWLC